MPSSGLWERAEPGWRSEADTQRAEANVRREGMGTPGPRRTMVVIQSRSHAVSAHVPATRGFAIVPPHPPRTAARAIPASIRRNTSSWSGQIAYQ
jgi:hypothetical protein